MRVGEIELTTIAVDEPEVPDRIRATEAGRRAALAFRAARHALLSLETVAQVLRVEAPSQYPVSLGEAVTLTAPATMAWAIVT